MTKTNIRSKGTLYKEGSLAWIGVVILEIFISLAAVHFFSLISKSAGLWHCEASLGRDLWWYFGSSLSYADRAAKWFGFRKACQNFAVAVVFETTMFYFVSWCLDIKTATGSTRGSAGEAFLALGTSIRLVAYTAALIFSRASSLYSVWDKLEFRDEYQHIAAHDKTWILFWLLVCVVLALTMRVFTVGKDDAVVVTCLLIIVALIAFGTYFNENHKTLSVARRDVVRIVENVEEALFRH